MSPDDLAQKVFRGSIFHYLTKVITNVFNFLIIIYVIRKLKVEEYGLYNFLLSIILLAQIITSFGLAPIIQRYLPEFKEKRNNYFQKKLILLAMLVRFIVGFVFVLILLGCNKWIIKAFNLPEIFELISYLMFLIILFVLESQLLGDAALISLFENKYWGISKCIYSILKFSLFFLALNLGYGILGIVWAWLVVEGLLFILFFKKIWKVVFSLPVKEEEVYPLSLKRFLKFGLPLWFQNCLLYTSPSPRD